jgi:tetratricopeptide (TPR) repeat protein
MEGRYAPPTLTAARRRRILENATVPASLSAIYLGKTMTRRTIRYQPFKAFDGDYETLLRFAEKGAALLSPGFTPPATRTPEWIEPEGEERYWTRRGWSRGDSERGFAVTFGQTIEPRCDGIAASSASVRIYGLAEGVEFTITCARDWFDPRYLEMTVAGPEAAVGAVVRMFETEFAPISDRVPSGGELDIELIGIKSALRWRQWEPARARAEYVLRFRPDDPEALFALGVAAGATGDAKRALELLSRVVELSPEHHDAWYNLGIAFIETGSPDKAVDALERALSLSPGDGDIKKQLARARKPAQKD